ncbi:MAP7 domain-containing protein 1-like [Panicum hallii]|uniref:MAP7 domain-containing protein 1-like n=1 Tax=Panicum hallii TaxID=206008 RepID=UPI000DF4CAEE|nr:MAP7 domain-containing protein 1-like [Panicum hallii]
MACMYTGPNDCCRIARGPGTDFTRAELEVTIHGMTSDTFSLETLVLLSGVKALCEDQALLSSQRTDQGPGGPSHGGPAPAGRGKEKVPVLKHRHKDNVGAAPTRRDNEAQRAAPARSSQAEGSKARRLQRGDGSFVGEPAPKRQKMVEAERPSRAPSPPPQCQQPEGRSEEAWRPSPEQQIPSPPPTTWHPVTPAPPPLSSDASSASAGIAPAGGFGPQPAPSSSPAGRSATTPAGTPPALAPVESGPGGPELEATLPRPEAAPQEEAAHPAMMAEAPAAAAAPDTTAGASPAEPAVEEAAVVVEAPAPEVTEVASTATPPAQEEEPEVVYERHLLPCLAKVPLPRLLAKSQQALEELEAGIHQEWEELDAECLRLSNWERRLGDHIKIVSARYAGECAELVQEREDLQEQLQKSLDREAAAAQRERAAVRWETQAIEREPVAEMRMSTAEERTKTALELTNQAKVVMGLIKEQEATLTEREAAVVEGEAKLAAHQEEQAARTLRLQEWEAAVEEELSAGTRRLQEQEVTEAPPSLGTILPVLDSTTEHLRHMEAAIFDLLETEGRAVARGMAEYILTCFRSHNPAFQLTPILVGPIRATAAAAQEGVQAAADMVATRVRRHPRPTRGGASSGPPAQ